MKRGDILNSIAKFLRRIFLSDPHLWLAFLAAAIALLWYFLHKFKLTDRKVSIEGFVFVITLSVFALVLEDLRKGEQLKKNTKRLDLIYHSFFDARVALRSRPLKQEDYDYLWGGYTGTYSVYNPSYQVEAVGDQDKIVETFIDRYRSPNFKEARYLFLTGDDSGKNDLADFQQLMKRVKQEQPNVVEKIRVKEMKGKEASSEPEMYLGTRFGKLRGVMELKEPTIGSLHGMPYYYLVIDDEDVIRHYLNNHFDKEWTSKDAQVKTDFWQS